IKAANKGGPRFDPNQSVEERRGPGNLLFMCHRHHKETDDVNKYSVEKLLEIKHNHESKYTEEGRQASEEMIDQIKAEAKYFWKKQKSKTFPVANLKMSTDFGKDIFGLLNELENEIDKIER